MAILSTINSYSPAQAMWGLHLLMPPGKYDEVSSGIWDGVITYSSEIDAEQQETTEAQNPIDQKGGDKQKSFSITVQVNKLATGQDPLLIYSLWVAEIGKCYPFFIGALPIDTSNYRLKSVGMSFQNADIAPDGAAFRIDINLDFEEDIILRKKKETNESGDTKKTASNVGASKAAKKTENIWGEPVKKAKKATKKASVFS